MEYFCTSGDNDWQTIEGREKKIKLQADKSSWSARAQHTLKWNGMETLAYRNNNKQTNDIEVKEKKHTNKLSVNNWKTNRISLHKKVINVQMWTICECECCERIINVTKINRTQSVKHKLYHHHTQYNNPEITNKNEQKLNQHRTKRNTRKQLCHMWHTKKNDRRQIYRIDR